jgi:chorismate mutase/prephenate dehydrogenase
VTFGRQLATTREVAGENPSLYYEIQALNEVTPDTGRWLRDAVDEWVTASAEPDDASFAALMASCRAALDGARHREP